MLVEGANENLSIEYCRLYYRFLQKKIFFVNLAFSFLKKNLPFGVGGWDLMLFFRICKQFPFGIYELYRLHLIWGGGQTSHTSKNGLHL